MKPTRIDSILIDTVVRDTKLQRRTVARLLELGLLDRRQCLSHAMCRAVEQLTLKGETKCRAMDIVAMEFCCSYEKVRNEVYKQKKI